MSDKLFDYALDSLDPLVAPIVDERKRQQLTQQQLADMSGLSRRALGRIERGGDCALSTLRRLYTALGIDVQAQLHRPPTLDEQIERNQREFQSLASRVDQRMKG
ncbi:helix-turn-helix transcriptional regulator [Alcaligenaceae bacterium]|nr:helix-turn-helix transcriptional regulator [Alcaligenaceae bacterium]